MALAISTDRTLYLNYEPLSGSNVLLQPINMNSIREARNILARKRLTKEHLILKLKKKVTYPVQTTDYHKVCRNHVLTTAIPTPATSIMTTCYPYQQDHSYVAVNDWNPMHSPLFSVQPIPVIVPRPSPIFATHICPFAGTVVQPVTSPIVPQAFVPDSVANVSNYINEYNLSAEPIVGVTDVANYQTYCMQDEAVSQLQKSTLNNVIDTVNVVNQNDPLECYLGLPKEWFPSARMLTLDPNPIIDEFCKMPNLELNTPWLLDLEFGIPRSPITRSIPTYNVKFNSIHCKNAPEAVHPGFESCEPDFKYVLLFYYDCIVSAWYRGYIIMNCDRSVENFQSWLLLPMQVLGMCWP